MRLSEQIRGTVAQKGNASEETMVDLESVIDEIKHVAQAGDTYIFAYRGIQGCSLHLVNGDKSEYQHFKQQHLFDPKPCFAFYRIDVEANNRGTLLHIDLAESLQILDRAEPQSTRTRSYTRTSDILHDAINDEKIVRQISGFQGLSKGDQMLVRIMPNDSQHYRVDATIISARHMVDRDFIVPAKSINQPGDQNMLLTVHHSSGHVSYSTRMDITADQAHSLLEQRRPYRSRHVDAKTPSL